MTSKLETINKKFYKILFDEDGKPKYTMEKTDNPHRYYCTRCRVSFSIESEIDLDIYNRWVARHKKKHK